MPLQITSTFLSELRRRRDVFAQSISAVLKVTPDLAWVYMQEHGTASMGDRGGASYNIYSKAGNPLRWVDSAGFHMRDRILDHPGIPAQHFIAQEQEEIVKDLAVVVLETLLTSGWDYDQVKAAFLDAGMNQVKARITAAVELHIEKKSWRIGFGKLKDSTPAEEFERGAYIEERS